MAARSAGGKALLRYLPSVDSLLQCEAAQEFGELRHEVRAACARQVLSALRTELITGRPQVAAEEIPALAEARFAQSLRAIRRPSIRQVINCTGVILHTGLGRAVLSGAAVERLKEITAYCNLEFDLDTGTRGERTDHVETLLRLLTGAEAACVVNNNAAAVFLALNTLGFDREVVISRGELIEIGGSFRIPDIMSRSGTHMVEVGTTNKTHLRDFEQAINSKTAGFLHVHTSNYRIQGFTHAVSLPELVELARKHGLFVLHDLGGGVLTDLRDFGLPHEPIVAESIAAGADVVTFSGDKMLGGPQCGIVVGRAEVVDRLRRNPLMRVLRCDKLTYVLLEETLKLFLTPQTLPEKHAVMRMFTVAPDAVKARAEQVLDALPEEIIDRYSPAVEQTEAQAGSGSLPLEKFPSYALVLRPGADEAEELARDLRTGTPAVVGYIRREKLYLDLRTVPDDDLPALITRLQKLPHNS